MPSAFFVAAVELQTIFSLFSSFREILGVCKRCLPMFSRHRKIIRPGPSGKALRKYGPAIARRIIVFFLRNCVCVDGVKSQPFAVGLGLRQECMLSPLLFYEFDGQSQPIRRAVAYKAGAVGAAAPQLEKFRANSVFRASSSSSKILNDKKYFNTLKNFRANLVFQGKRRLFKIQNGKKYIFNAVNSGYTLFFRASKSCSKILNVKTIFNTVKNLREISVFGASSSSPKNPER